MHGVHKMSYSNILANIHRDFFPQENPDTTKDDFEDEIQSLRENLAELLARRDAFLGKTGNQR